MSGGPDLIERFRAGDAGAFDELLIEHLPGLTGFVRLRTGGMIRSREETVDLVQSICREALAQREKFVEPGENGFRRWLYATALRKIGHRAERLRAAKRDPGREAGTHPEDGELLHAYASLCTPSQEVAAREEVERIEAAFEQLPPIYREAVLLRRIAGLEYAQIAAEVGKSEVAVRSLVSRGLAKLAELLRESDPTA